MMHPNVQFMLWWGMWDAAIAEWLALWNNKEEKK